MTDPLFTQTFPPGDPLQVVANQTSRYAVTCGTSGMRVEFTVLAGQAFKLSGPPGTTFNVNILEAEMPGTTALAMVSDDAAPKAPHE